MKTATKTDLTSVKIISEVYHQFKKTSIDDKISLQQVVNRAVNLYITDRKFRDMIHSYKDLSEASGSKF